MLERDRSDWTWRLHQVQELRRDGRRLSNGGMDLGTFRQAWGAARGGLALDQEGMSDTSSTLKLNITIYNVYIINIYICIYRYIHIYICFTITI